jgi:tetratricopeptide (TPR) repeat protein
VATGVIPLDTTGLPPGGTFGASTGLGTAATALGATTSGETAGGSADITGGETVGTGGEPRARVVGPLKVGQSFGPRYHIIKLLGAGGMGAVYQAWDAELSVAVALKVIRGGSHRASAEAEKRFKTELLLARAVTHKNVVRIHDLGEIDGTKYITMSYVQGADLASLLRKQGKLPIDRSLRFARQVAAGLEAAHEAGVVHRDLKPANVMIGADDLALIMDFGISASTEDAAAGGIVGTLEYMAPEQGAGKTVDGRADIYAFGLILYEMLSGPRASTATTAQERISAMRSRTLQGVTPLHTLEPAVPEALATVVDTCLAINPDERFQTTADLRAALAALDDAGARISVPPRVSTNMVSVATAIVLTLAGTTYFVGRRMAAPPVKRPVVSVLVTDFDNRSGDATLDAPLTEGLRFALDGTQYIALYPARDAHSIAAELSKDHSNRLTDEMGRLIARREGVKMLVEGTVERSGNGYRLSAKAIDPASNATVASATETANTRDEMLKAVQTLAGRVRVAVGESKSDMDKLAAAETFTAGSLEAMQAYARAQDLVNTGKVQDALAAYQTAIDRDPQMGRAYSGMAVVYRNLGQMDRADATYKQALKYVDRMSEREKYRTLGSYYVSITHNYPKAIETYETLLAKYPNDQASMANLAFSYSAEHNFAKAVEISRQIIQLYPRNIIARANYAAYALYAGDFDDAIAQADAALQQNPSYQFAFLPRALAQLSKGDTSAGLATYARFDALSPFGASVSRLGVADYAIYEGRYRDAVAILTPAIAEDEEAKDVSAAAAKYVALADAQLALGRKDLAAAAARRAASLGSDPSVLFPAALTLVSTGNENDARDIADSLGMKLENAPRSYARLIDAMIYRRHRRVPDAIDNIRDAQKRFDSWWSRYLLGQMYEELAEPHHAEALAELELAIKRRGEAADAFAADTPMLRYVPAAYYWLGRAQEGMQATPAARRSYQQFLAMKHAAVDDPLVDDARKRDATASR